MVIMKNTLIIGNSGGVGAALEAQYQAQGWYCTGICRQHDGLELREPDTIKSVLATIDGPFDTVVIATGALCIDGYTPEKTIKSLTHQGIEDQMLINAIGPALILSQIGRLLPRKTEARIAVLSARVGSIADNKLGGWISYRASKAALNQIVRTSAIELSRSHPLLSCILLHPGTVETRLTKAFLRNNRSLPPDQASEMLYEVIERRTPGDTGKFFDQNGLEIPW